LFWVLTALLSLLWAALAFWILGAHFGLPASGPVLEDVTDLYHIPGIQVRVWKALKGDSYDSLARRFSVSTAALRSLNQNTGGEEPLPDGEVLIPSQDGVFHWVHEGQGLSDIARAYGIPAKALMRANRKATDRDLQGGDVLYLPEAQYLSRTDPRALALERLRTDQGFIKPTTGRFADGFGKRIHPISHKETFHEGLDLAPGAGHQVYAAQTGRVIFASEKSGYGRLIILSHGKGLESWYAHLAEIRVKKGQDVRRGDWIGRVGSTGRVTGPHLHFEIRLNGKPQNPLLYLTK